MKELDNVPTIRVNDQEVVPNTNLNSDSILASAAAEIGNKSAPAPQLIKKKEPRVKQGLDRNGDVVNFINVRDLTRPTTEKAREYNTRLMVDTHHINELYDQIFGGDEENLNEPSMKKRSRQKDAILVLEGTTIVVDGIGRLSAAEKACASGKDAWLHFRYVTEREALIANVANNAEAFAKRAHCRYERGLGLLNMRNIGMTTKDIIDALAKVGCHIDQAEMSRCEKVAKEVCVSLGKLNSERIITDQHILSICSKGGTNKQATMPDDIQEKLAEEIAKLRNKARSRKRQTEIRELIELARGAKSATAAPTNQAPTIPPATSASDDGDSGTNDGDSDYVPLSQAEKNAIAAKNNHLANQRANTSPPVPSASPVPSAAPVPFAPPVQPSVSQSPPTNETQHLYNIAKQRLIGLSLPIVMAVLVEMHGSEKVADAWSEAAAETVDESDFTDLTADDSGIDDDDDDDIEPSDDDIRSVDEDPDPIED